MIPRNTKTQITPNTIALIVYVNTHTPVPILKHSATVNATATRSEFERANAAREFRSNFELRVAIGGFRLFDKEYVCWEYFMFLGSFHFFPR